MTSRREFARRLGIRPTLRVRLTALYGAAFFLAGLALVAVLYALVAWNLDQPRALVVPMEGSLPAQPQSDVVAGPPGPFAEELERAQQSLRDQTLSALLWQSLIALAAVGMVAVGLGYVLAGRALRPLHQVTATARRVADDRSLHERIALSGPRDEIKELADTFDAMLARLDAAFAGQRRFAANASHELRTPLAVNRTLLEVALTDPDASEDLRRLGRTLLATNERSERLIDGLLLLARSEHEVQERHPVDLADLATHALEVTCAEAQAAGVRVTRRLDPARTAGDPLLLERLVLNVIQNAVRHNVPGGELSVRTGADAAGAVVEVSNTGPEIPAYEIDTLFEPFRRLGTERLETGRGVGLGLSIVRSVTRAHGGHVTATARRGGGLAVRVTLPLA